MHMAKHELETPIPTDSPQLAAYKAKQNHGVNHLMRKYADLLLANGVCMVTADYSGGGDSGQLDGISFLGAPTTDFPKEITNDPYEGHRLGWVCIDTDPHDTRRPDYDKAQIVATWAKRQGESASECESVIENLMWALIDGHGHNGFWNDDGGRGEMRWDLVEDTVTLAHVNYYTAEEAHDHEGTGRIGDFDNGLTDEEKAA